MSKLEPHELSKLFPPISDEDFGKLAADIKLNGLHQPIVRYQGKILDGNNRYRACELVKIAPGFTDFEGDDAKARNFVISANIHRRHLSPEQRRDIIATLLKADPSQSNRQIADTAKTSHVTVGAVRSELEATGQIDQLEKTTGADGKSRKRKAKPKGGSSVKGNKVTITYQEVVNIKTALNAYGVLEEHLLDALQDVNDKSSATIRAMVFVIVARRQSTRSANRQPNKQENVAAKHSLHQKLAA
jgi:ParB-like chromosome segregation protein Spo0J